MISISHWGLFSVETGFRISDNDGWVFNASLDSVAYQPDGVIHTCRQPSGEYFNGQYYPRKANISEFTRDFGSLEDLRRDGI